MRNCKLLFGFILSLTVIFSACKKEENAIPVAAACFEIPADEANTGEQISFTNCSQNAIVFTWNFGDDSDIVTEESPAHIYKTEGEFIIKMVAANDNSIDTISKTITINQANGFFLTKKYYNLQNAYWVDKNGEGISIWLGQTNPDTGANETGSMAFYFSGFSGIPAPGTYIINNINGEGFYVISDPVIPGFNNTSVTLEITQTGNNYTLEFRGKVENNEFTGFYTGEVNKWL